MDKPLRVGVLGVGSMGKNHLRVLSTMPEFELVGCFDVDQKACTEQAEKYGIAAFRAMEDLFSQVEVVHIVVPSHLHRECAVTAAAAGCHILVEKPIALSLADADAIIIACQKAAVKLCVGHIERYNPAIATLKGILAEEEVIALTFERMSPPVDRIQDASVVEDLMIHDIDILNSLVNAPVKNIVSQGIRTYSKSLDYAQALISFQNGVLASLTASRITEAKIRTVRVSTERAYISVDYIGKTVEISRKTNFKLDVGYATHYSQENIIERVIVPMIEPLWAEFNHFANCIRYDLEPDTNGLMAKKALVMCQQIQEIAMTE